MLETIYRANLLASNENLFPEQLHIILIVVICILHFVS